MQHFTNIFILTEKCQYVHVINMLKPAYDVIVCNTSKHSIYKSLRSNLSLTLYANWLPRQLTATRCQFTRQTSGLWRQTGTSQTLRIMRRDLVVYEHGQQALGDALLHSPLTITTVASVTTRIATDHISQCHYKSPNKKKNKYTINQVDSTRLTSAFWIAVFFDGC